MKYFGVSLEQAEQSKYSRNRREYCLEIAMKPRRETSERLQRETSERDFDQRYSGERHRRETSIGERLRRDFGGRLSGRLPQKIMPMYYICKKDNILKAYI